MYEELNSFPLNVEIPQSLLASFLSSEMTASSLQLAETLIEKDQLEKNDLLLECALRIQTEWDLYACALALRNGANPAIYITETGESLVAAIIKKYTDLVEDSLVWRLLTVLHLSGLDVNKTAFLTEEAPTIKEFCESTLSIKIPMTTGAVRAKDRFYILHLVGKQRELPERKITESEARFCIKARCLGLEEDLREITTRIEADSVLATMAITFHNEKAFQVYVEKGGLPSYALMNILCKLASTKTLSGSLWEKVLLSCIAHGTPLDNYQYQICKIKPSLAKQVKVAYEIPYWKKFFRDRVFIEYIPERIDDYMTALSGRNYDLSLESMKSTIERYSKAKPGERAKMVDGEEVMPVYYIEYTYDDVLYRVESQNFHRFEKLPSYLLLPGYAREKVSRKIRSRILMLRSRQLSPLQPVTRRDILESMLRNDSINDDETDRRIGFYYSLFEKSPSDNEVLDVIYEIDITSDHRRATIAHIFADRRRSSSTV